MRRSTFIALTFIVLSSLIVRADTCTPLETKYRPWQRNTSVTYDTSGLSGTVKDQVEDAIRKWNTANQNNQSGVRFTPGTSGTNLLKFKTGVTSTGAAAETAVEAPGGLEHTATTTYE